MLKGSVFKIRKVLFPLFEEPDWNIQSQVHSAHLNFHDVGMLTLEPLCAVKSLESSFKCSHVPSAPNAQYSSTAVIEFLMQCFQKVLNCIFKRILGKNPQGQISPEEYLIV